MRGHGQIAALCEIAQPHIGVITTVGPVHLELLGTVEHVAEAKGELLAALPPDGIAVIPVDAPALEPFVPKGLDVRRFAPPPQRVRSDGWCELEFHGRELAFSFTARHQATNAAAALTALEALGLPLPERPVEVAFSRWRGEESELPGGGLLVNDAYNANPESMRAALEHLVARAEGRRTVAVLGEMAELGNESPRFHAEVGDLARALGVAVVVGIGPLGVATAATNGSPTFRTAVEGPPRVVEPGDACS